MKKTILTVLCLLFLGKLMGCTAVDHATTEADLRVVLAQFEAQVIPHTTESGLAYFNAVISGDDADYEKSAQTDIALKRIYSDTAAFAKLKAFRESGNIDDPELKRQLEVLYLRYLGNQVDPQMLEELVNQQTIIEQKFNTFRVTVPDRVLSDNQVDSILRNSTNSEELRQTWLASKTIGREVAPDIIALVKLRNRIGRSLGFANYYEMELILDEQNPAEIISLFAELDSLTDGTFAALKGQIDSVLALRYNLTKDQLQPWHYQNQGCR